MTILRYILNKLSYISDLPTIAHLSCINKDSVLIYERNYSMLCDDLSSDSYNRKDLLPIITSLREVYDSIEDVLIDVQKSKICPKNNLPNIILCYRVDTFKDLINFYVKIATIYDEFCYKKR